jgi:5-methyltetrahydrofolate corrinoid/iron sulfur protein methyltransferase
MLLIGENIHIISKKTRIAIQERDEDYIKSLARKLNASDMDYIDLNIGPARRQEGTMAWLINAVSPEVDLPFSLDTTNLSEMEAGLKLLFENQVSIINSTSGDPERLNSLMPLAAQYNANIIGLTMDNVSGIPKDPDGKLEIAMAIMEKASEIDIDNDRVYLDPLVLPVSVAQDQAVESLNSIRVFKEAFDPPVNTIIGLSNVSNSAPKENRPLINRVYLVLAMGCGLDSAIVDAFDDRLKRYVEVIEYGKPETTEEKLILDLYLMMKNFDDLDSIEFDLSCKESHRVYKTAQVLLNKNIYAHNYLNM